MIEVGDTVEVKSFNINAAQNETQEGYRVNVTSWVKARVRAYTSRGKVEVEFEDGSVHEATLRNVRPARASEPVAEPEPV